MTTSTNKLTLQAITDMARSVQTYVSGQLYFSGLHDTPTGYLSGYYLESTATGISYIDPTGLAGKIPTIPNTYESIPEEPIEKDGEIIKVGCDLYLSCDGEWIKFSNDSNAALLDDNSSYPACVNTVAQALDYQEYKDSIMFDKIGNLFDQSLNGDNVEEEIYNVCLFSNQSNSTVKIDETTYPWGLFQEPQIVNITATPGTASDREIVFSRWAGDGAVFGNANSSQTTLLVDKDLSVTGYFSEILANIDLKLQQKFRATDTTTYDSFGKDVSMFGDRIAVGAPGDDDNGITNIGSVYIFEFQDGTWTQTHKLLGQNNGFGASVSFLGDQLAVGAPLDDDLGTNSGSVYIFELQNGTWTQKHKLRGGVDTAAGDYFGESVSFVGDRLAVGAPNDDEKRGSVYIFELQSGTWTQTQKIRAADTIKLDYFGTDVSLSGDRLAIGSYTDDLAGPPFCFNCGSVYIYELQSGTWTQTHKFAASDTTESDRFGGGVSLNGDRLAVSADWEDDAGRDSGSVYIFEFLNNTWTEKHKFTGADTAAGDYFGAGLSLLADRIAVGAYADDDGGGNSGSVYIYSLY